MQADLFFIARHLHFVLCSLGGKQVMRCILLCCLLGLAACAADGPYRINLMPAPDVYEEGYIDPFADSRLVDSGPPSGIFYATDRPPAKKPSEPPFYGNVRGHLLRLGTATIRLGDERITWDEARRISLLKNRIEEYPLQVERVNEFGILEESFSVFDEPEVLAQRSPIPAKRFAAAIDAKLAASRKKDIFIYVPGFKITFENPVLVAAELWHFLGYEGAFIAYSWPATPSVWAYASDVETTVYAARNLRLFLAYLARETQAERIHIVGYSAGTRVVAAALDQISLMNAGQDKAAVRDAYRIGHVILIGSDLDQDLFGLYLADGLLRIPLDLSVYLSGSDMALGISGWFFSRQRLGQVWEREALSPAVSDVLRRTPELHMIDVTDAEKATAGNGHDYFRRSPWASSDILMTLLYDLAPASRGLMRTGDGPLWQFPPDYIARLRKAIGEARQEAVATGCGEEEPPEIDAAVRPLEPSSNDCDDNGLRRAERRP